MMQSALIIHGIRALVLVAVKVSNPTMQRARCGDLVGLCWRGAVDGRGSLVSTSHRRPASSWKVKSRIMVEFRQI